MPSSGPSSIGRGPLRPAILQRASQLLARHVGPIAVVLCHRAAQLASDEAHLYAMLADKLTEPAERARFLKDAARQG